MRLPSLPLALAALCSVALPSAAQAKWLEASTSHFVIYADEDRGEIQTFSEQLERFHSAMALLLMRREEAAPSPSNRVTIYVVRSDREVRKLAGDSDRNVYAFYVPRAGGSIAIVPKVQGSGSGELEFSMIALLHEYAHHFQLSAERFPVPRWFGEGSAEFFASAKFNRDGAVELGRPAMHRAGEIFYAPDVTATNLLDPETYERRGSNRFDAFYGKSWLLYHYLTFSTERQGQLSAYLQQMREGKGSAEAARAVFGDLAKLEKELERYTRQRMVALKIKPEGLPPVQVAVRELSAGEAAVMPIRIRSRRGVDARQAAELLPDAQAVAARFPRDAAVLAALAEAEHDAGHDDAAIAAADAAIAIDPKQVNAYVQKGYALFRKARDAEDKPAALRAAQAPFIALNKLENDHPLPLVYYYMIAAQQGRKPPELAVRALERAVELAPFDLGLRGMLVFQQLRDKQFDQAIANLTPIAYNPHGGQSAERARIMLDKLKSPEGRNGLDIETMRFGDEGDEHKGGSKDGNKDGRD